MCRQPPFALVHPHVHLLRHSSPQQATYNNASISGPCKPETLCEKQLKYAEELFDKGEPEKCIEEVKKNLSDEAIPPYYLIKNCILIACATDDWDDADIWRLRAELAYDNALDVSTRKNDQNSLELLRYLRKEIDQLNDFKMEDLTGTTREQREKYASGELDTEEFEMEGIEAYDEEEDAETVTQVESDIININGYPKMDPAANEGNEVEEDIKVQGLAVYLSQDVLDYLKSQSSGQERYNEIMADLQAQLDASKVDASHSDEGDGGLGGMLSQLGIL